MIHLRNIWFNNIIGHFAVQLVRKALRPIPLSFPCSDVDDSPNKFLLFIHVTFHFLLPFKGWTKRNAFHICITSYNIAVQDHRALKQKKWKYLILDEVIAVNLCLHLYFGVFINFFNLENVFIQ